MAYPIQSHRPSPGYVRNLRTGHDEIICQDDCDKCKLVGHRPFTQFRGDDYVFKLGGKYVTQLVHACIKRNQFEIREGDGNDGCYYRGKVYANDAFDALTIASRTKMIRKPKDVLLSSFDGDHEHAYAASYVAPIYGDACRWCAEANLVVPE